MPKVYSDLYLEGQLIYNNNPTSGYVLTTDENGIASWTASISVIGTASSGEFGLIKIGSGLSMSSDGFLSLERIVIPDEQVFFDQDTPTTPGVVFNPDIQNTENILYISDINSSTWTYNGVSYSTFGYTASNTPFNIQGTSIDAGGNKTSFIERYAPIRLVSPTASFLGVGIVTGYNTPGTRGINLRSYLTGSNTLHSHFAPLSIGTLTPDATSVITNNIERIGISSAGVVKFNNTYTFPTTAPTTGQVLGYSATGSSTWVTPISYTAGLGLTLSGTTFSLISVNTKRIYVSVNGSDSNNGLTDATPFLNIKTARDLAVSGNTIIVMPGTYTYDNRASNGNFWNGKQADINLWKNGVTYYFEPGSKIVFYNQTVSGQDLYLINPTTTTGETCTILGYLEYEQYSTGADSSNGANRFYYDINSNPHIFYAEIKSLYSEHCEFITIFRTSVGISESKITIITDSEIRKYVAGQSSSGTAVFIGGISNGVTDDSTLNITLYSKYRNVVDSTPLYIYGNLNGSSININGEVSIIRNQGNLLRRGKYTLNYNIDKTYITRGQSGNLWYGSFFSTTELNNSIINIKGDIIDYQYNSETNGVFHVGSISYNNIVNFDGNITTKTSSGIGRFIALTDGTVTGNIINIKGDINYIGTASTTQYMFRSGGGAGNIINYTGKVTGNFACPIANCYSGIININNSNIISLVDGPSSSFLINGATALGMVRISNSYIQMSNSSNSIGNGSYVKALINNSSLINSGTSSGISNTTNFGTLQMVNSLIYATTTPVNYTGTVSIIASNVSTNSDWVGGIIGGFDLITDLSF